MKARGQIPTSELSLRLRGIRKVCKIGHLSSLAALMMLFITLALFSTTIDASEQDVPLRSVVIDTRNEAALQRGAKMYMNYCAGCHSLQYVRYGEMARDIGIADFKGQVYTELLLNHLVFTDSNLNDPILSAMPAEDAAGWFGLAPPDLSLIARIRSADWLFTYLTSFYTDEQRPFGTNNWVYPDTAMPNVLEPLQGKQLPLFRTETIAYGDETKAVQVIDDLQLLHSGWMDQHEFDSAMQDLVTFLAYAAEPYKHHRQSLGWKVIIFLLILLLFTYLMKRAFWRSIKPRNGS